MINLCVNSYSHLTYLKVMEGAALNMGKNKIDRYNWSKTLPFYTKLRDLDFLVRKLSLIGVVEEVKFERDLNLQIVISIKFIRPPMPKDWFDIGLCFGVTIKD